MIPSDPDFDHPAHPGSFELDDNIRDVRWDVEPSDYEADDPDEVPQAFTAEEIASLRKGN